MHLSKEKLDRLRRLRAVFMESSEKTFEKRGGAPVYWQDPEDLALYDEFFAERIRLKWDRVLEELCFRGLKESFEDLTRKRSCSQVGIFDFGVGTGAALDSLVRIFPEAELFVHDQSPLAVEYCRKKFSPRILKDFHSEDFFSYLGIKIFVSSHTLGELSEKQGENLLPSLEHADLVIWVEPGTPAIFHRLQNFQHRFAKHRIVWGPCPSSALCPLQGLRSWCHSFVSQPSWMAQDARWSHLARDLGMDLRSVSYSYLAFSKTDWESPGSSALLRVLGRPLEAKGHFRFEACRGQNQVGQSILQKRDSPELFKQMKKGLRLPFLRESDLKKDLKSE